MTVCSSEPVSWWRYFAFAGANFAPLVVMRRELIAPSAFARHRCGVLPTRVIGARFYHDAGSSGTPLQAALSLPSAPAESAVILTYTGFGEPVYVPVSMPFGDDGIVITPPLTGANSCVLYLRFASLECDL